jgi:murein L,D-transpeptidase YcbB/YkuD
MFPNPFAVYLHGTPNRVLFSLVERDVSSGCIRVESPVVLANFVLADNDRWTVQALNEIIEKGETRVVWLNHPIPVHLVYLTAWVDATGVIQFRRDIYDRDRDLERALSRRRTNQPLVLQLFRKQMPGGQ